MKEYFKSKIDGWVSYLLMDEEAKHEQASPEFFKVFHATGDAAKPGEFAYTDMELGNLIGQQVQQQDLYLQETATEAYPETRRHFRDVIKRILEKNKPSAKDVNTKAEIYTQQIEQFWRNKLTEALNASSREK